MAQINQTRRIVNNDDEVYEENRNPMGKRVEQAFYDFLVK